LVIETATGKQEATENAGSENDDHIAGLHENA